MNYGPQMRLQDLLDVPFDSTMLDQQDYGQMSAQQPMQLAGNLFGQTDLMTPAAQARYKEATGEAINASRTLPPPPQQPNYNRGEDDAATSAWKLRNLERQRQQLRDLLRRRGEG